MSNYQPHNQRPVDQQRNRNFRQQEAANYPNDQFDNPQQHSRDPWRQGREFDQDENYGWNRGDRDYEQQGSRSSYGQQGMSQGTGPQGYGPSYGRPQAYGLRDYSDDAFERNRDAYQSGGFTSGNQPHPIEESDYRRNYGGRRNPGSRSEGNYPDYDAMNPRRQYQSGRSNWPDSAQQAAQAGTGYSGGRWSNDQSVDSLYPESSLMDYGMDRGDSINRQADYSFGGNRGVGGQGGFAQQSYRGRAPKGYERSDERVREDICERLSHDHHIDASDITVTVKSGVVTLEGTIENRLQKHRVEDLADACSGVKDVQNRLSVTSSSLRGARQSESRQQDSEPSLEAGSKTSSQQKPTRQ